MRKLSPAQKLDLVLAHPHCSRSDKNSFVHVGDSGKTRRLHAMYATLYPRDFLTISPGPNWEHYAVLSHEIGQTAGYSAAICEVGIVCPIQWTKFTWARETARFAADLVARNTARLTELSPCRVAREPDLCALYYIPEAWSREYKESLFEEYSWHNAWLAGLYTDHAAALKATPKCTKAQYQHQLERAAKVGGLRPELAAKWQAMSDAIDAVRRA